jgi:hypothetical protein
MANYKNNVQEVLCNVQTWGSIGTILFSIIACGLQRYQPYLAQGVGANKATVAHVAMQVPRAVLQARTAGMTPTAVTPNTAPADE